MKKMDVSLGKIYCKYNTDLEDYERIRLVDIDRTINDDGSEDVYYTVWKMDAYGAFNVPTEDNIQILTKDQFIALRKEYNITLDSDGILAISNTVVMTKETGSEIKDVCIVFFPDRDGEVDFAKIGLLARQALNNPYYINMGIDDVVGFCITEDAFPDKRQGDITQYLMNQKVLDTKMCHIYKMDNLYTILALIDNNESNEIFGKMYDDAVFRRSNIDPSFDKDANEKNPQCINGYCKDLTMFFKEMCVINDIYRLMGISKVDFVVSDGATSLTPAQTEFISLQYGGINIVNTIITPFDYDIDMSNIHMKTLMFKDATDVLWLVAYTESPNEFIVPKTITSDQAQDYRSRIAELMNLNRDKN